MKTFKMNTHQTKAEQFQNLHTQGSIFVMPCAWDAFSATLFEQANFHCIGTTSGGVNWVNGRKDYVYSTPASEMLRAYGQIASATHLPVSGDLENGYGGEPESVASTIEGAIASGLVGGSIEDQHTVPSNEDLNNGTLYELPLAVERIAAARQIADASDIAFTLTARCEVYYTEHNDPFSIAMERATAYRDAGADCIFVPGLNNLEQLKILTQEVDCAVSFGMGATPTPITLPMLEDAGVIRVSTGGGITRALLGQLQRISNSLSTHGDFSYLNEALSETQINSVLERRLNE